MHGADRLVDGGDDGALRLHVDAGGRHVDEGRLDVATLGLDCEVGVVGVVEGGVGVSKRSIENGTPIFSAVARLSPCLPLAPMGPM